MAFVDTQNCGAPTEYRQTGKYLEDDLSATMAWDDMKNINGTIPVRVSDTLLSSDERVVAHICKFGGQ